MLINILSCIFLPFWGTAAGAALVFLLPRGIKPCLSSILSGFASGIMVAASIWSLLIPSIDLSSGLGTLSFLPAATGVAGGVAFIMLGDKFAAAKNRKDDPTRTLTAAVTLHNLPEGMAVGAALAAALGSAADAGLAEVFALAIGISVQNVPEGAIISLTSKAAGAPHRRSFASGVISGAVEPLGAAAVFSAAGIFLPLLPFTLAFSAGAMLYAVVAELVPEMKEGGNVAVAAFTAGFILMMSLDVVWG